MKNVIITIAAVIYAAAAMRMQLGFDIAVMEKAERVASSQGVSLTVDAAG